MENKPLTRERVELKYKIEKEIRNRAMFLLKEFKRIRNEVFGENYPMTDGFSESRYKAANYVECASFDGERIQYTDSFGSYGRHFLSFPESFLYSNHYEQIWREDFNKDKKSIA